MDDHLLRIFKVELLTQCEHCQVEVNRFQGKVNSAEVWTIVESILSIAANVSKILWGSGPTNGKTYEFRKPLRDAVAVADDSPLRPRKVRNAFEHFDERIQDWFDKGDTNVFTSRNIGPDDAIPVSGKGPARPFGNFNPETGVVRFWDQTVDLHELIQELDRIHEKVRL